MRVEDDTPTPRSIDRARMRAFDAMRESESHRCRRRSRVTRRRRDDSVARGDDETLDRARVPPSPIDTNDDDDDDDDDDETDDDDGLQR